MANPQTENGFLQIANEIWNEVIRRDFSKRQKDIILFIWRLSYGCKKKYAYIPKLIDFELCGIGKTNITKELNYLVEMKVISWDRDDGVFTVNKDYERWQVSPVRGWSEERFKKLISKNLGKSKIREVSESYQNNNLVPHQTVKVSYQNNNFSVIKTITLKLSKQELSMWSIPCRTKLERMSKERFKEILKKRIKRTTTTTTEEKVDDYSFGNLFSQYQKNFIAGGKITQFDVDEFQILYDDFGGEWLLKAMREAYKQGPEKRNLAYVHGVLKGYKGRGSAEIQEKEKRLTVIPYPSRSQQRRDTASELRRQAKEDRQREQS